ASHKALAACDVYLAEKLTQSANALGVPESQFLPDEDRPSLIAWDIARAKQKDSRPQPAKDICPQAENETYPQTGIARLPATRPAADPTSRYETPPAARYEAQPTAHYETQP